MSKLLELKNLSLGYDAPNILQQVNLTLNKGEVVALIGANGVGKTSLLHSIMGLTPKIEGAILFNAQPITHKHTHDIARQGIALVKQEHTTFPELTVREHFTLTRHDTLEHHLTHFPDLIKKAKSRAKHLSGGQRQQLAIALALANKPKLLLLDEPSANIQPSIIEDMIATLNTIKQTEHLSILMAEQNLLLVSHLATRVHTINAGQLDPYPITFKQEHSWQTKFSQLTQHSPHNEGIR